MLDFPIDPKDGDVFMFESQNFVFHSSTGSWWPEGITEPINTAVDRSYTNFYLSGNIYVTIDKSVLERYLATNKPNY